MKSFVVNPVAKLVVIETTIPSSPISEVHKVYSCDAAHRLQYIDFERMQIMEDGKMEKITLKSFQRKATEGALSQSTAGDEFETEFNWAELLL